MAHEIQRRKNKQTKKNRRLLLNSETYYKYKRLNARECNVNAKFKREIHLRLHLHSLDHAGLRLTSLTALYANKLDTDALLVTWTKQDNTIQGA